VRAPSRAKKILHPALIVLAREGSALILAF
jgi:hypothetical protein